MSFRALGPLLVSLGLYAACKGASETDLLDPNAPQPEAGAPVADAATSSSSGSGDAAVVDDAAASSSSSTGGIADAAPDVVAGDPDVDGVFCGAVGYCSGATPVCCAGRPAGANPALGPYQCKAACEATETAISCDDAADCAAGTLCCNTNNANGTPQTVMCLAAASCPYEDSQTQMCDPNKADGCNTYEAGSTCQQHGNMAPGFSICVK